VIGPGAMLGPMHFPAAAPHGGATSSSQ